MHKFLSKIFMGLGIMGLSLGVQAEDIIVNDNFIKADESKTFTKDNTYFLDGFVFVEDGATLTIEPGTVIKGLAAPTTGDNASALIIAKGAKIMAEGTADEPIIFTAEIDEGNGYLEADVRGLWGGVIVLGQANIARPGGTDQIEGIPADEVRAQYGGGDDADNSGILKYVSIRHGGAALSEGNEINGLTLGGVGSGTTVEYVEVFASDDDGIEWFGGTVSAKYLSVSFCKDDCFDYDYGWRGKGQFWFALMGSDTGDNAGEHDGAKPDGETPFSKPTIYNATYIGAGVDGTAKNSTCLHFRDAAGGTYANSIFTGFVNHAIEVEDLAAGEGVDSRQRMEDGDLVIKDNIWWQFGAGSDLDASNSGIIRATRDGDQPDIVVAEDPDAQFLIDHLSDNGNTIEDPNLNFISRSADGDLDPRPASDGPAYQNVDGVSDTWFEATTYKGAFGDALWILGWTALDALEVVGIEDVETNGIALGQAYPNPVEETATIDFALTEHSLVTLKVFDLTGKEVSIVAQEQNFQAGTHTITVDCSNWEAGMYFYTLQAAGKMITKKMLVK